MHCVEGTTPAGRALANQARFVDWPFEPAPVLIPAYSGGTSVKRFPCPLPWKDSFASGKPSGVPST